MRREMCAPILYMLTYSTFEEALELHKSVPQGLSSSIFATDQREAERFMAADGSTAATSTSTSALPGPRSVARSAAWTPRAGPRVGLGLLAGIHAASDQYHQLLQGPPTRPGVAFA
jgi:aldehyde dehydrogenase family protein